jgi:hypothetical protein
VVVRERIREGKAAVGRKLIDVPGYTFRIWATNRIEEALALWRDRNGRATIERRIEELKHDLAADGFCTQNFWATEAAFLAVLFTFNLLSLYQQTATPKAGYRQPATLRTTVFLCGAILGRSGRQHGIASQIAKKGAHHIKLTEQDRATNRRKSRVRGGIERIFAHWKKWQHYRRVRYLGLARNKLKLTLKAVTYNLKRLAGILGVRSV